MDSRVRLVLLIAAANVFLFLPLVVLPSSQFDSAGGLLSVAAIAMVSVTYARGLKVGITSGAFLGLASAVAIASASNAFAGVIVMTLVAVLQGLTGRSGLNKATIMIPVTLAFVVTEPPAAGPLSSALVFGLALAGFAMIVAATIGLITKKSAPASHSNAISRSRTASYAALLSVTTIATSSIALSNDWGHTGGWLIMTPFIVIQPYVQDGWRKALARAGGTVLGFAIAYGLAELLGPSIALTITGFLFATAAILARVKVWPYAVYATFLTPAIVIIESSGRSVTELADKRLEATILGVALSMIAMAIAVPIYRRQAHKLGLEKY